MNLIVHQQILIHSLRVDSVSNASVLQIGSAGTISNLAQVSNTGRFGIRTGEVEPPPAATLVPLPSVTS